MKGLIHISTLLLCDMHLCLYFSLCLYLHLCDMYLACTWCMLGQSYPYLIHIYIFFAFARYVFVLVFVFALVRYVFALHNARGACALVSAPTTTDGS